MNYLMTKAETREIAESIIEYLTSEYFKIDMLLVVYIVIKLIPIIITIALIITVFKMNKHLKSIEMINERMLEKIADLERGQTEESKKKFD